MYTQWLKNFCLWIQHTSLSNMLFSAQWVEPNIQTIHILGIAMIFGSAMMINLRLLGITFRSQSIARVSARFLPVIWWMLPAQLFTGIILIVAEPTRELLNWTFQLKMLLLIGAILVTLGFQASLKHNSTYWEALSDHRVVAKLVGLLSWVGVIFAGRWIAYT